MPSGKARPGAAAGLGRQDAQGIRGARVVLAPDLAPAIAEEATAALVTGLHVAVAAAAVLHTALGLARRWIPRSAAPAPASEVTTSTFASRTRRSPGRRLGTEVDDDGRVSGPAQAPLHPVAAAASGLFSICLLLALPVLAAGEPDFEVPRVGAAGWWTVVAVLVAQAVAVAWVGRFPTVALPGLTALPLVLAWAVPGGAFSTTAVVELVGVFLAVVARPRRRGLWVALVVTALLLATGQFLNEIRSAGPEQLVATAVGALLQGLVVVGLPLLFGLVVAAQRDTREARRHELAALRREQDALLQAAVSRERMSMSRELHDIAAHHMSGIALMAAAMERQVDTDPATAKESARQVREQSRAVLDDLRRLVGLLREEADATRPVQTLDAVAALVENRRAAGAEIDLVVPAPDTGSGVGPLGQLVVHRMVQESLANAAVHAPGARCAVEIGSPDADRLTVVVRNGAPTGPDPGPGGGFGLIGMAERAQLVGGELTYGATPDGGWEVRLTLPVENTENEVTA